MSAIHRIRRKTPSPVKDAGGASTAVHGAVQRSDRSGRKASVCACGGGCPRCAAQPKLSIGASNDPVEREADRMADRALRGAGLPGTTPAVADSSVSGGAPLPQRLRGFFEPRFGHDFSAVRVHAGEAAARDNDRLGARAFTLGNHISLARGESLAPSPLLAHELAHVVQNDAGAAPNTIRRQKEDWDFTPAEYAALKKAKGDFKLASDSSWVPAKLQDNLLATLRYTLDAKRKPAATEGVNVEDFYHGHLVVPNNDKGLSLDAIDARKAFQKEKEKQTTKALGGEFENVTGKNFGAYSKGIEKTLPLLAKAVDEVVKIKGAAVMYHTYELTAQAKGIKPHDPRRNYLTPFDTNTPKPYKLPKGAKDDSVDYVYYLEFTFLVDQNGEVHVRPGGRDAMSTIIGTPLP